MATMGDAIASSAAATRAQDSYQVLAFFNRKPGMTLDDFYHHWDTVHGPIVQGWAKKHGLGYTQIQLRRDPNQLSSPTSPTSPISPAEGSAISPTTTTNPFDLYDGCALWSMTTPDQLPAAFADEYYKTLIAADEPNFVDKGRGVLVLSGVGKVKV